MVVLYTANVSPNSVLLDLSLGLGATEGVVSGGNCAYTEKIFIQDCVSRIQYIPHTRSNSLSATHARTHTNCKTPSASRFQFTARMAGPPLAHARS